MIKQLSRALKIIFFLISITQIQAQINSSAKKDSIFSNTLNEYKNFWVQLPENYNPNSSEKYPVIYIKAKTTETLQQEILEKYKKGYEIVGLPIALSTGSGDLT